MLAPRISVIVPVFEVSKRLLASCLESVANQTLRPEYYEVLIHDDGSSDDTAMFIEHLVRSFENFKVLGRTSRRGTGATRNEAIALAKSDLVALLDADDILVSNALESTLAFHDRHPSVRYSYGRHFRVSPDGRVIRAVESRPYDADLLLNMNFISPLKCFERALHEQIGGYDVTVGWGEDWDHALRASELLRPGEFMLNPQYLYKYVIHERNSFQAPLESLNRWRTNIINAALRRRQMEGNPRFSHVTEDGYTFYEWRTDR